MEPLGAGERAEGPKARRCECTLFCFQFQFETTIEPTLSVIYIYYVGIIT